MKDKRCLPWELNAHRVRLLVLAVLLQSGLAGAAENMRFSGSLITPPDCTINDGQQIDVNFGDHVGVSKVDGVNYLQTVNYQLRCEPNSGGATLGLTLTGPQAAFDTAALQTSRPGLGVRLTLDGQPFRLATRVPVDASAPPVLRAVPVRDPDVMLTEGAFEVLATLRADYQ